RVGDALVIAEEQDRQQKDVLASLNKGMLRRIKGNYQASNQIFEVAKKQIEELYGISVSEQAGALVVNDAMRSYSGDRYEQVLLHAYMAMNYIEMDDLDAARVEMLQADVKMQEWGEQPEEDPFVRYLSGMIYEALGEKDEALIAYRQAKKVYQSTKDKQSLDIPLVLKTDLLRMLAEQGLDNELRLLKKELGIKQYKPAKSSKDYGELIVVLSSGLASIRNEKSIIANTGDEIVDTVRISLPAYEKARPRNLSRLVSGDKVSVDLELVEDVDALARNALSSDMPLITARAIARAVVKHKMQDKVKEKRGELMGLLATVTNVVTERADTRSWTTLPQTIQMARVRLPKGTNKINIEIYNTVGTLVDTTSREVVIKPGQKTFLTEHWVAPNMSLNEMSKK
ncbi:MAG: hypothetical protein OEZ15_06090, partial [Gammaproteobacteria bacterium]|nr:hypothetical protein [Gammaproteobacteria bacterium]